MMNNLHRSGVILILTFIATYGTSQTPKNSPSSEDLFSPPQNQVDLPHPPEGEVKHEIFGREIGLIDNLLNLHISLGWSDPSSPGIKVVNPETWSGIFGDIQWRTYYPTGEYVPNPSFNPLVEFDTRYHQYLWKQIDIGSDIGEAARQWIESDSNLFEKIIHQKELRMRYTRSDLAVFEACSETVSRRYDEEDIIRTKFPTRRCLIIGNIGWDGKWFYAFNEWSELPENTLQAMKILIGETVDRVIQRQEYHRGAPKPDPIVKEEQSLEHCKKLLERYPYSEPTCVVEQSEKILEATRRLYATYGEFSLQERAQMRAYIEYQETRCARMPFEEAKKDFECRSIQIRDYLRYGPKGAPPEEMQKRASRTLAPKPPKLPWETTGK